MLKAFLLTENKVTNRREALQNRFQPDKSIVRRFSPVPEACPTELSPICNCLSVPCLYIITPHCGWDAVIPFLLKKANKRKPSETGLSLSDSQAFHYHGSQFVCACMYCICERESTHSAHYK